MRTNGPIFNFKKNLGGTTMDFTIFILNRKNIIILYKISFLEEIGVWKKNCWNNSIYKKLGYKKNNVQSLNLKRFNYLIRLIFSPPNLRQKNLLYFRDRLTQWIPWCQIVIKFHFAKHSKISRWAKIRRIR